MNLDDYYTRQQVAELLGITPSRVSALAKSRKWDVEKLGRNSLYLIQDVHAEMERRGLCIPQESK